MSKNKSDETIEPEVLEPEVVDEASEEAAASDQGADGNEDESEAQASSQKKAGKLSKKQQIEKLEREVGEWQDKYLRLRADFDNFRKRMQREISDTRVFSRIGTLEELLPVLDHFQMAMSYANQSADFETLKQGMDMISTEFERCFENLGVERLKTVGEAFDPNQHEAVSTEASEEVPEGQILREAKAGYRLGERLLRAPAVVVSSGPAESADDADEQED